MITKQFFILLLAYFLGYGASELLHIPIPSNVLGMIILFLMLLLKVIKVKDIELLSEFIIKYLPVFFVVPTVGIMQYFDLISSQFIKIIVPLLTSIIIGMGVTGKVTEVLINKFVNGDTK